MSIENDLRTLLLAQSSITDVLSSTGSVYRVRAPQNADMPYITITALSTDENKSLDETGDLRFVDFDIDCVARTADAATDVADAVRVFLQDFSGATGGTETIGAVLLNSVGEAFEPPADGSDIGKYTSTLDVQIHYNPA